MIRVERQFEVVKVEFEDIEKEIGSKYKQIIKIYVRSFKLIQ